GRRDSQRGRRPDHSTNRRPGTRGPRHLRALVRAGRPAQPTPHPRGGAGVVRASPAQGPGLYDRGRRQTPRLRPGQDAAAARPRVSRPYRRGNALIAYRRAGYGADRRALPDARAGSGSRRLMMTAPPRKPATVLIVDDEAGLRRVLQRYLERHG